jgi:hypothetical protein
MADSINQRFMEFRPSKTMWFWSTVGVIVVVLIVGFTWGGWVTSGTAAERAADAADQARAELAANICVHRYLAAPDAGTQLTAFKDASSYKRDDILEEGGWVTLAGADEPIDGAASLCADKLAEAEVPAATPVADASAGTMTAQPTVAD